MKIRSLILLVCTVLVYGCGSYSENAKLVGAPGTQAPPVEQEYHIHVGDKLAVKLFYNPDLNQEVTVRPDGRISLLLVHEINAAGMTPSDLRNLLTENYAKHLQQPEVAVIVNAFAAQRVFVGGEVGSPGAKDIVGPTSVMQAIALAGGFKETARKDEVIVVRRDENGKPFQIALDMEKAMKGIDLNQDVYVKPYDIVLVPTSTIADVNLWVKQYIMGTVGGPASQFLLFYNLGGGGN
ncbi:MAG: polysaccharide biosynthesis/export family protein [Syntrophobacteraceae bacterium]